MGTSRPVNRPMEAESNKGDGACDAMPTRTRAWRPKRVGLCAVPSRKVPGVRRKSQKTGGWENKLRDTTDAEDGYSYNMFI